MGGSYQGFGSGMGQSSPYSGWGQALPYTGQRPGNLGYNGGGINPGANMGGGGMQKPGQGGINPAGGGMPYTFDQGQGRADPYAGGATGGINPGANMGGMGNGLNRQASLGGDQLSQIRERLRPVMGNLVDQGNFGQFIQAQAGGTSLDPSQFGVTGQDQYGRDIWRMGQNNVMGYGDAARVQQRIAGEGGGGPLNLWASQLTGQGYNPANPYQLQGAAADTRQQGRQAVAPGLLSQLQGSTPNADQWSALMGQLGRGFGR